tara:strand:- start:1109 stop:1510 length:402 start_codon:yes stop_codon:yes gene_type:complete
MENKEHINIKNATAILLLSIANADNIIEKSEIKVIKDIVMDFFSIESEESYSIIENAMIELKKSTSYFEYAQTLNENFTYQDKLDFVFCIFEVAHIDNELHFKEQHLIKQISNILNIEHHDLIKIKIEIEKYL